ncbi:hypothetical protein M1K46_19590 [Fictibacillus sp. WQ 8-8]|uniref:type VII secretion protein EssB/YukC n=1 Tax=Fictibacillus sp. WQ 8-8 TaxID=2938788 RepID=UPI00210A3C9E|nr:type VII secretion protein EssB/YukC [Fictibacillus sp. WQ 8-8]MCQ6267834.1 hypothetical protein [Fictibacillus sp. WQ 8-8]
MKIQLFEHGTLFISKEKHYRLEIGEDKVVGERTEDLEDLKAPSPYFFQLSDINKENDRFLLNYEIEDEYQPLTVVKNYSTVMRLSLLYTLLETDPLGTFSEKVLVHPRNIFFKDLKTIKFLYRSNRWLPYDQTSALEQYKILILSLFSRFTYEKYKRDKEKVLKKEKEAFFFEVANAASLAELKTLLFNRLTKEETEHFFQVEQEKSRLRQQKRLWTALCAAVCLSAFGGSFLLQQNTVHKVETAYAKDLNKEKQESKFYRLLSEDNYEGAITHLKKNHGSKKQLAQLYFDHGDYQQAIDTNPLLIKPTIKLLYERHKEQEILKLKGDSPYLQLEKKIVSYDYGVLLSEQSFTKDKDQLLRIGKAFVAHGDLSDAKNVNQRLRNKQLGNIIQQTELKNKITVLEKQIQDIKDQKKVKENVKKKQLKPKNLELQELKAQLQQVTKELG